MKVEGNSHEVQQIQPAAKRTESTFDKYCVFMMDTHMRLRCKKLFLVVNKTKTIGECFVRNIISVCQLQHFIFNSVWYDPVSILCN